MSTRPTTLAAVYWACRAASALHRAGGAIERFAGAFGATALESDDKRSLTVRIYDSVPAGRQELFDWERLWFERDLPASPARVLVGGCGRGREVGYLLARGYDVWAFDPSLDSIRQCQRDNPSVRFVGWFGYEALAQSLASSALEHRRLVPRGEIFDAVLLGWASFTHVLDEQDQLASLRTLSALAPDGPILASFYMSRSEPQSIDRATRAGARVGRLLQGNSRGQPRVRLHSRGGFSYYFDEPRLSALAAACDRRLALHVPATFPHATFWPLARGHEG